MNYYSIRRLINVKEKRVSFHKSKFHFFKDSLKIKEVFKKKMKRNNNFAF